MRRLLLPCLAAPALGLSTGARAEVPHVVADTAPVHSLVAMVLGDLGSPALLIPAGTSPHHAELRPADVAALAAADVVIWTGPDFLPRVGEAIASVAPEAASLPLLDTDGWAPLVLRGGAQDHDHGPEHDHAADDDQGDEHDHESIEGALDPHAWLDPAVAEVWVGAIADALSAADPAHADVYAANADAARRDLAALATEITGLGALGDGATLAVGHDAYAYFERASGLARSVPLGLAEGGEPRAADAARLSALVTSGEVACLVLDAETSGAWGETLGLRTVRADADGVYLTPGADLYPKLVRDMATAYADCLAHE